MEENESVVETTTKPSSKIPFLLVGGAVLAVGAVAAFTLAPKPSSAPNSSPSSDSTTQKTTYKDGQYTATGNYVSPGGPETISVSLTLKGDTITDASVEPHPTNPNTERFQGLFAANFKAQVVGKSIDEVKLSKVSGSSLTPRGFNDALEQIKAQAKA